MAELVLNAPKPKRKGATKLASAKPKAKTRTVTKYVKVQPKAKPRKRRATAVLLSAKKPIGLLASAIKPGIGAIAGSFAQSTLAKQQFVTDNSMIKTIVDFGGVQILGGLALSFAKQNEIALGMFISGIISIVSKVVGGVATAPETTGNVKYLSNVKYLAEPKTIAPVATPSGVNRKALGL